MTKSNGRGRFQTSGMGPVCPDAVYPTPYLLCNCETVMFALQKRERPHPPLFIFFSTENLADNYRIP